MISFLIHLKKAFQGSRGGAMETPHHGNVSKNRLIKHIAHRSRAKSLKVYKRLPFHFHGTLCIKLIRLKQLLNDYEQILMLCYI